MMKSMMWMMLFMFAGFLVMGLWSSIPIIKTSVHAVFDPSAGMILNWNMLYGMTIVVCLLSLITTLAQKYGTDQETLRKLKAEQKLLKDEADMFKHDPEKLLELNKKQLEFVPKTMDLTMRPLIYTFIPFILLFRWFSDYFTNPALTGFRFFGFLSWIWFYLLGSIIFGSLWRKVLKVA